MRHMTKAEFDTFIQERRARHSEIRNDKITARRHHRVCQALLGLVILTCIAVAASAIIYMIL